MFACFNTGCVVCSLLCGLGGLSFVADCFMVVVTSSRLTSCWFALKWGLLLGMIWRG